MPNTTEWANEKAEFFKGTPGFMLIKWSQYHKCQAWIGQYGGLFDLIKSYKTIVGLVDKKNKVVYELGCWSRTTTQQVRKIYRECYQGYEFVPCKERRDY